MNTKKIVTSVALVLAGYVLANYIKKIPLVNKLPQPGASS